MVYAHEEQKLYMIEMSVFIFKTKFICVCGETLIVCGTTVFQLITFVKTTSVNDV